MKILMLNYEFPPMGGGAANANYYLLKEFSKEKNLKIDLITSSPNKFKIENFSKNITIYKLNVNKKDLHYWKALELVKWTIKSYILSKKLIKKNKYNLCHSWFGWPTGIIAYLNQKKIPYLIALRGSDVPGYNPRLKIQDEILFRPLSKLIWKNAKKIIANSNGLKKLALNTLKKDIKIIPNGIDTKEFKPAKMNSKNKKIKLISTGRLIERKGYKYLIKALKGLNQYQLTLIGEGNKEKELKELSKKLKVKVNFLGKQNKKTIIKELQKSDIFLLPSLNEGMSNSILEAMACGLPIITTDTGGTKELINKNGIIIKQKSIKSISETLKNLKREDLKALGKQSKKIAEKMNWKEIEKEYKKEYEKI